MCVMLHIPSRPHVFVSMQMIEPVADALLIPRENIFANKILFHPGTGEYAGFDADEPTSRDGGKPKVVGM